MTQMTARELCEIQTAKYQPPPGHRGSMMDLGLPNFTLRQVEMMLRDPTVKLGMAILKTPLQHVKFECTGRPDVVAFVNSQMKNAWDTLVEKITNAMAYKVMAGEPIYRKNATSGFMELAGLNDFYPQDVDFLEVDQQLVGIRVRQHGASSNPNGHQDLFGMKSFVYIHKQRFRSRDGISELEASYQPWLAKMGPDGALAVRTMWFYKNAYHSGIIFHPPGNYQYMNGTQLVQIPYRDLARQAIERGTSGAVWAFPQAFDEKGNRLWEYVEPKLNGDAAGLISYVEQLNTEILRGLGIPDDILAQNSGTGSYAGRSIPFAAFLASLNETARAIFQAIERQILAPLAMWNFGSRDFEFHGVEVDRDMLLPSGQPDQGQPMGGPPQGDPSQGQDPQNQAMAAGIMQQAQQQLQPTQQAA